MNNPLTKQVAVMAVHTVNHEPIMAADPLDSKRTIGRIVDDALASANGKVEKIVLDFTESD